MTYSRAHLVNPDTGGIFHCTNRCVRQTWLSGEDPLTGQSLERRRQWIEDRITTLARIFAVRLHHYAIMSDHYHLIIETQPQAAEEWSNSEVIERWLKLRSFKSEKARALREAELLGDSEQLSELRHRLGNLSHFMARLNEFVARKANAEDGCKGRFWEGQFRATALLDETALTDAVKYVALLPYSNEST